MQAIMPWLIFATASLVVVVLVAGLFNMVRKTQNARRSNALMRWRVGLQFLAVMLLLAFMLLMRK